MSETEAATELAKSSNPSSNPSPCQACGACCAYSSNWPRFTTEDDTALDLIPPELVNERLSGMRCNGDRCAALQGEIAVATACTIYAIRPEVCRTCLPGDAECTMARRKYGLAPISANVVPAKAGTLRASACARRDTV